MGKIKILIAEDSRTQAMQLRYILEENNYEAVIAANGREALSAISVSGPSIVISDIIMPEMDGYELCRRIKADENFRDIGVILLTSLSLPQDVIKAVQCGADKFITKPYDERHLISTIENLYQNKNLKSREENQEEIRVSYGGQDYRIASSRLQILSLLLSTYETAVAKNLELIKAQDELRRLNKHLEERVEKRTEALCIEVAERKKAEARLRLHKDILEVLNRPNKIVKLIEDILCLLKKETGIEACGIRLKEGEDYPYFVAKGFSAHFIETENSLCARNADGTIIRDSEGHPQYECMCGNVLCGRTDPSLPFFTAAGSFWTNSSTKLLAETSEKERQARTRTRCSAEGYESIALIPLRSGGQIIGLLQLNDSRQNIFASDMIRFLEGIGASIGIAVARKRSMEALRESEEKYTALYETSRDGIAFSNMDGNFRQANRAFLDMVGYEMRELEDLNCQQLTPGKWHGIDADILEKQVLSRGYSDEYEKECLRKDGAIFPVAVRIWLMKDADGNPVGMWMLVRDMTEQKLLEQQRIMTEKMTAVGMMAAGIAHELNNPLMGIHCFIEYCMKHMQVEDKCHAILDNAKQETQRCMDLVKNLLTFSHTGHQADEKYRKESCRDVFDRVAKLLSYRIEKDKVRVIKQVPDEIPEIWTKGNGVQQVILNLMTNALDAVKEAGKKEIRFEALAVGDYVQLSVSDTGAGIPPEHMQRIFDPFFTTKPVGKGTGLGLSVSRSIVSAHKGKMTCESKPGQGTTFKILLPVNKD